MFCSKCGKEIDDNSKYCYSCGSKIEFKSVEDVSKVTLSPLKIEDSIKDQNIEMESSIDDTDHTDSNQPLKTKQKIKKGYGWFILFWIYGYGMSVYSKNNPYYGELYSIIISFIGLIVLFPLYFWFRRYLINKKFMKGNVGSSSFLSGLISYIFVGFLVGVSIGFIGGYFKGKEKSSFIKDVGKKMEMLVNQEIEYSKIFENEPKTKSELNDKILSIDKYKIFLKNKKTHFDDIINFFRMTNSKYKKDRSIDIQINKLQDIISDNIDKSLYSMDMYKKYLVTGNEQYLKYLQEEYERQQLTKSEVTKLITSIHESL